MKPLIIWDLDETLVHSVKGHCTDYDFFLETPNFTISTKLRPHVSFVLKELYTYYDFAVWTASGEHYANHIVSHLFNEYDLCFVKTSKDCTIRFDPYNNEYYKIKTLKKIKKRFDLTQVLIVDDVPQTAERNYGNLITISPFTGDLGDNALIDLMKKLIQIKDCPNFRKLRKPSWQRN